MKQGLIVLILLGAVSCRSFKFDDRMISYTYTEPNVKPIKISGDYEVLDFTEDDPIYIMCYYFRDSEISPRSLIVSIVIDNKFAFESYGQVVSKEFGLIPLSDGSPFRLLGSRKDHRYILSLDTMDMAERKSRILRDTISINFGNRSFTYAPKPRID
ncbi:hypothetical protein SAMN06265375_101377 [Muriicola jejuensis]|uniref:Uncharacterized protein n=1 Tax=Muriicola jejuensis TaxID=504488 RepID=A0A6P0UDU7_9FLAO|nr:hypothetical protein [Muriicola jejuensis]NER10089.1 hypothetical protein [Muriicola jejuensis]SMP03064.1 hypothetical protein SAMN06265375_101377 [Muriicola jejuensis]